MLEGVRSEDMKRLTEVYFPALSDEDQTMLRSFLPRYYTGVTREGRCVARIRLTHKGRQHDYRREGDTNYIAFLLCMEGVVRDFRSVIENYEPPFLGRSWQAVQNLRNRQRRVRALFDFTPLGERSAGGRNGRSQNGNRAGSSTVLTRGEEESTGRAEGRRTEAKKEDEGVKGKHEPLMEVVQKGGSSSVTRVPRVRNVGAVSRVPSGGNVRAVTRVPCGGNVRAGTRVHVREEFPIGNRSPRYDKGNTRVPGTGGAGKKVELTNITRGP